MLVSGALVSVGQGQNSFAMSNGMVSWGRNCKAHYPPVTGALGILGGTIRAKSRSVGGSAKKPPVDPDLVFMTALNFSRKPSQG